MADTEAGRPTAVALAPWRWRDMFEVWREGGPWKSAGGGRRAEGGCLVFSGFGSGFVVGEIGEVGETLGSRRSPISKTFGARGAIATLQ
jgi:hypothetical protein